MTSLRSITSSLLLAAASLLAAAQDAPEGLTATKCLSEAPTSIFSLIDNNTRLDMLDYFHAGIEKASTNSVGGECYVTDESPYSVSLKGGEGVEYQLFVLNPTASAPLIGVVETVATPISDSKVTFYDQRWHKVRPTLLPDPVLSDWLTPDGKKHRSEVEDVIPFILATYTYDPESQQLTAQCNMAEYYVPSDTPEALKYLKDKIVYRWDGKTFKASK